MSYFDTLVCSNVANYMPYAYIIMSVCRLPLRLLDVFCFKNTHYPGLSFPWPCIPSICYYVFV